MTKRGARAASVAAFALAVAGMAAPAHGHEMDLPERQQNHIVDRARSVVGTPYSYGGGSPGGFDCSGLTRWVFAGHGADLPHSSSAQFALGDRPGYRRIASRGDLKKGDLVFHDTTDAQVGHVGIYVGSGNFISATSSEGVQVRSLYDPYYWGARWVGGVRLPTTISDDQASERKQDGRAQPRTARSKKSHDRGRPAKNPRRDRWGASRYRPEEWRPHGRRGRP